MTTEDHLQAENARLLTENVVLRVEVSNLRAICESLAYRVDAQASVLASRAERFDMPQSMRAAIEEVFTSLSDHLSYVRPGLTLVQCRDKLSAVLSGWCPAEAGKPAVEVSEDEVVIGGEG